MILTDVALEIHDFEYTLHKEGQDFLARFPLTFMQMTKMVLIGVLAFNKAISDWDIQDIAGLLFSIFQVQSHISYREYHEKQARQIKINCQLYLGILNIIMLLLRVTKQYISCYLAAMCFFPMSFIVACRIEQSFSDPLRAHLKYQSSSHNSSMNNNLNKDTSLSSLFYIQDLLSQLDQFSFVDYYLNPYSILLETISTDHRNNCKKSSCFCQEHFEGKKAEKEERRRRYLVLHIDGIFHDMMRSSQRLNATHFYYINFLVEQWRSKSNSLYFLETLRFKQKKAPPLLRIYHTYAMKKIYALFAREYQDSCREVAGLVFEDILKQAAQQYEQSLYQKLQLLGLLNSDHVSTSLVQQTALQLFNTRSELRSKLGYLSLINQESEQLKMIHAGFIHSFCLIPNSRLNDLNSIKLQIQMNSHDEIIGESDQQQDMKQFKSILLMQQNLKVFEETTCVMFLSAEHNQLGVIKRAQQSFQNILKLPDPVGKPISTFLPSVMSNQHNEEILNSLTSKEKYYPSVIENSLVLAKSADGFAVPLKVRLSLDHVSQFSQIGFVCSIEIVRDASHYLLISNHSLSLHLMSELYAKLYYSRAFHNNNKISCSKILPQLQIPSFIVSAATGFRDTLMMLPTPSYYNSNHDNPLPKNYFNAHVQHSKDYFLKLTESDIINLSKYLQFFVVSVKIHLFKNTAFPCFIAILQNIEMVYNLFEIHPFIQSIQQELLKNNISTNTLHQYSNAYYAKKVKSHKSIKEVKANEQEEDEDIAKLTPPALSPINISIIPSVNKTNPNQQYKMNMSKNLTNNTTQNILDRHSIRYEELTLDRESQAQQAINGGGSSKRSAYFQFENQNSMRNNVIEDNSQVNLQNKDDSYFDTSSNYNLRNRVTQFAQIDLTGSKKLLYSQRDQISQKDVAQDMHSLRESQSLRDVQQPQGQNDLSDNYDNSEYRETVRQQLIQDNHDENYQSLKQISDIRQGSTREEFVLTSPLPHEVLIQFPTQQSKLTSIRHNYQGLGSNFSIIQHSTEKIDKLQDKKKNDNQDAQEKTLTEKNDKLSDKVKKENNPKNEKQEKIDKQDSQSSLNKNNIQNKDDIQQQREIGGSSEETNQRAKSQTDRIQVKQQQFQKLRTNSSGRIQQLFGKDNNSSSLQLGKKPYPIQHPNMNSTSLGQGFNNSQTYFTHNFNTSNYPNQEMDQFNIREQSQNSFIGGSMGGPSEKERDSSNSAQVSKNQLGNDKSSVNGSRGSTKEILKQVERKIMISRKNMGLQMLNFMGFLSVVLIIVMILWQELNILSAFEKASIDFNFVSEPMELSSQLSGIQYYVLIYFMNVLYLFPRLRASWKTFSPDCLNQITYLSGNWTILWVQQINSNKDYTPYFTTPINTQVDWIAKRDAKSFRNQTFPLSASEFYFQQNYLSAYKTYMNLQSDNFNQQALLIDNIFLYQAQMEGMKGAIKESSISSLNNILSSTAVLMVLCISLSFLVISLIYPMYAYIQSQTEKIFKLMSTISSTSLIDMSQQLQTTLQLYASANAADKHHTLTKSLTMTNKNQSESNNNNNNLTTMSKRSVVQAKKKQYIVISLDKQRKKRNISSIESLRKFSFHLLVSGLVVFGFVIALPVLHYFLIDSFKTELILNVNVLYNLYDLKNQFVQSIYLTLGNTYWKMAPVIGGTYKGTYFQEMIPQTFADNNIKLSTMTDIIAVSSNKNRYDDSDYRAFFYPILKTGVCDPLENFPQFANLTKYQLNLTVCRKIRNGILQKGFMTSTRYFFDLMVPAFEIATYAPSTDLKAQLTQWEASVDLQNLNDFYQLMITIITILKDFMQTKGTKYLAEMKIIEILIASFQIIILLVVFALWWFLFYSKMSEVINKNRRLLSLFEISFIMENSYILSYLNSLK